MSPRRSARRSSPRRNANRVAATLRNASALAGPGAPETAPASACAISRAEAWTPSMRLEPLLSDRAIIQSAAGTAAPAAWAADKARSASISADQVASPKRGSQPTRE